MNLGRAVNLMACPHCRGPLTLTPAGLRCAQGHSFDVAKQGYVNLLGTAQPANADTPTMLAARERVHRAGVFEPVRQVVAATVDGRSPILEVGAGTGHYLSSALGGDIEAVGVALDVSTAAARTVGRTDPRIAAVVADVWRPLPFRDAQFAVVLAAFAPRNLPEFSRVLRPDGRLVVVTPRPDHLSGLRDRYGLLEIPSGKADHLATEAAEFFDLTESRVLRYRIPADVRLAADLIAMGPNAFHHVPDAVVATTVTVDVTVQAFTAIRS